MAVQPNLPIGVQSLAEIINGGYYYVDKTPWLHRLIKEGKHYFLSRPRRFGKSPLLDTLKELFEANEPLFRGLYIHDRWDWQTRHPVIRISFTDGVMQSRDTLDARIEEMLSQQAEALQVRLANRSIAGRFGELIRRVHQQHGQRVVVLIDEYDKPILDNITDADVARELREGLKNLYSVLKDADPHLKFCLLTGVSKFSKVSLFSGLNNLNDITLDKPFAPICGYTDEDIDTVFAPELPGLDREQIRQWYNGYRWGDETTQAVYNPFDVLLLFQKREFRPYWFESATPSFLVKLLSERGVFTPRLDRLQTKASLLGRFDVDDIATEALLFQTGYLTVHKVEEPITGYWLYTLGYPNRDAGNTGRVDMTVDFNGHIYLFEFKVVEQVPEGRALRQLQDKGYADKYRGQGKPIHLIGVEFSREQRQIIAFDVLSL
ncbi:ATP-binding protein [Ectothiorhodospira lacustris]|uniref:ATP-binding protein n=1 Tax=Ectothiorhodospira lacustris TaxID=2899127 RepID=UPI001EE8164C|nr:ATP-binding protein [Ectothiorhodospira lacustris]MCG5509491.1 ATP-binding protein [Ectothiorhodospira lacustris]MCG5521545.1 ATP-binding protein [Ectothiorhodospira lacustris]